MAEARLAVSTLFKTVEKITSDCLSASVLVAPEEGRELLRHRDAALSEMAGHLSALQEKIERARQTLAASFDADLSRGAAPQPEDAAELLPQPEDAAAENCMISVRPGVHVPARVVEGATHAEVEAQIAQGGLCYSPLWGHFAIELSGHILHGNIGRVLPRGFKRPVGVKECAANKCYTVPGHAAGCHYYHNPARVAPEVLRFGDLLTVRSFLADSFEYSPSAGQHVARYGGRAVGDLDALGGDIQHASAASARRFLDQVGHDIVCAIALLQARPDL